MICPAPLKKGDKVAVICLSSGIVGEPYCAHEKELGLKKLREFGLEPVFTEHALRGAGLHSFTPRSPRRRPESCFS